MKTEAEIAHKLKQVQFRHAKREIEGLLAIKPSNCAHNRQLELAGFGKVGFCAASDCPKKGKSCDTRFADRAVGCSFYEALHTPDDARTQVKSFFKNAPPSEIAAKYSDVAALIWSLDDERAEYPDPYSAGEIDGIPIWVAGIDDADAVKSALEDHEEATVKEIASLEEDLADAAEQVNSKQSEINALNAEINALVAEIDSLNIKVDSLKAENTRLAVPKPNSFMTWLRPLALVFTAFVDRIWKKP